MLPGIGSRLAEKIVEIMETGSMTKLEEYQTDADIAAMDLFGQIWGIGPAQAKRWVDLVRVRQPCALHRSHIQPSGLPDAG